MRAILMMAGVFVLVVGVAVVGAFAAGGVCAATAGRCPSGPPANCEPAGTGPRPAWAQDVREYDGQTYWCAEW
jgi:hypothetical protein